MLLKQALQLIETFIFGYSVMAKTNLSSKNKFHQSKQRHKQNKIFLWSSQYNSKPSDQGPARFFGD